MQITIETIYPLQTSKDIEVQIAQGNFLALLEDLFYLPQITSPSEFISEYSAILSEAASFMIAAHDALLKVTDPSVLSSKAYQTILSDLTQKTSPSLYEAAQQIDSNPYALASLLLSMKGASEPLSISQFEADINAFDML